MSTTVSSPDPEVLARPERRQFPMSYKLRILAEAEVAREAGTLGALLRREGLYASHLSKWRQQRARQEKSMARKTPPSPPSSRAELARLERENRRLRRKLEQAERIIEVQKKISVILGVTLETPPSEGEE